MTSFEKVTTDMVSVSEAKTNPILGFDLLRSRPVGDLILQLRHNNHNRTFLTDLFLLEVFVNLYPYGT